MATDPNITSENVYIGLSPLTLDDVRNFCNTYIKPFAPYQDEKVYDTLINNLTEYYYNQTYFNIPSELKQIYEEANIDSAAIYDQLLIAIGVPAEIINTLSLSNKLIFLKTLSDFERYKGTISFFQKVAEAFADRLSIYELFIDFDGTNWVFKPVKVYLHDDMELNIASIPYATVQTAIPSLLLSEEQLTTLRDEEKIILPIKSNLLMLDNDLMSDSSVLYDVIVAVFLHTYKENYIDIYFIDDAKAVQLKTVYFLWFYLLTEYYGIPWTAFASTVLLRFAYGDIGFPSFIGTTPTTIDNLATIIARYDNIKIINSAERDYDNSQSLRDSLYQDISTAFYTFGDSEATTATDMYNELLIMNASLINYIDDRITNTSIGEKAEINLILTEIYSSLVLYSSMYSADEYFGEYVDYFLRYLPQVLINPENTASYTILFNLKPYHVELFSIYNTGVRCQDKFNQVFIDDETGLKFLQNLMAASVLSFSDDYFFSFDFSSESPLSILSSMNFSIFVNPPEDDEASNISDSETLESTMPINSTLNTSDDYLPELTFLPETTVSIISVAEFTNFAILPDEDVIPSDLEYIEIVTSNNSSATISDDYLPPDLIFSPESEISMISSAEFNEFVVLPNEEEIPLDSNTQDFRLVMASILSFSIDYLMQFNKDLISDITCIDLYEVTKVP